MICPKFYSYKLGSESGKFENDTIYLVWTARQIQWEFEEGGKAGLTM